MGGVQPLVAPFNAFTPLLVWPSSQIPCRDLATRKFQNAMVLPDGATGWSGLLDPFKTMRIIPFPIEI
jgi:hypothetical protein